MRILDDDLALGYIVCLPQRRSEARIACRRILAHFWICLRLVDRGEAIRRPEAKRLWQIWHVLGSGRVMESLWAVTEKS